MLTIRVYIIVKAAKIANTIISAITKIALYRLKNLSNKQKVKNLIELNENIKQLKFPYNEKRIFFHL